MAADQPTILAMSGALVRHPRLQLGFGPLIRYAVELSGAAGRPRIVHLGTAGGDQRWYSELMSEAAHAAGVDLVNLALFPMPNVDDIEATLRETDVIYVAGGSVANLLAVWQVHGLGPIMQRAWQDGVVLSGTSAGSICWYEGGTTDSFGPQLRAVTNGLGMLPYANGVHYDSEASRRPAVHDLVARGVIGTTHCSDDGVGLLYHGTELVEAVAQRDGAYGWTVAPDEDHATGVVEEQLPTRRLPQA